MYEQYRAPHTAPAVQLSTNYSLVKMIFLNLITFGIYSIVIYSRMGTDINTAAGRYDGKKTMHYCLVYFLLSVVTLGIAQIVWFHKLSNRLGMELARRGIAYSFSAADFWLWNVLGAFIVVGPFIYIHKLCTAVNMINTNYNSRG